MFENLIFYHIILMIVLVIKISALIFNWLIQIRIRIWNLHLECGFQMRIQETKIMRMQILNTAQPPSY
jgi:hypothetical protein